MNSMQELDQHPPDRRYRQRLQPAEPVPVEDDFRHTVLGTIGNLSVSGMMLVSEDALPEGMTCQVRFRLPEQANDFVLGVEVLWTQIAEPGQCYWSGLRIIDISTQDHNRLSELLNELDD